ncbi:MAG: regulatory signaling modulator protein AmpE [Gammaproteobacteria bacterium]|nr:regulatory signaling modulator protein AmpE [Gammaproteobacteria bacterium]
MKFIILLICLLLQAIFHVSIKRGKYHLLEHYASGMKPFLTKINANHGWVALISLMLPILILVLILNALFSHVGILYFIYAAIVLLFCLDIRDMKKQLGDYFVAITNENLVKAQIEAEQFVSHSVHQNKSEMTRAVTESIFIKALTNIFSVIFWFMLLGPFGAVLYYLATTLTKLACNPEFSYTDTYFAAEYIKELFDWLPVRVLTLTFALIGHFGPVFTLWIDRLGAGLSDNRQLLIDAGLTALNADLEPTQASATENNQALSLVNRTLWTWTIVIGVLTITSWL